MTIGTPPWMAAGPETGDAALPAVTERDRALVHLSALLALDAPTASLQQAVSDARLAGVSEDEMVGFLLCLMPTLGTARTTSVAPHLALALGFDVDRALEER